MPAAQGAIKLSPIKVLAWPNVAEMATGASNLARPQALGNFENNSFLVSQTCQKLAVTKLNTLLFFVPHNLIRFS